MINQDLLTLCTKDCCFVRYDPTLNRTFCTATKKEGVPYPNCYLEINPNSDLSQKCRQGLKPDELEDLIIATNSGMRLEQYKRVKDYPNAKIFQDT